MMIQRIFGAITGNGLACMRCEFAATATKLQGCKAKISAQSCSNSLRINAC